MNTSHRYIVGDVLDVLRAMPDASVDLVMTSPPFLALRSYLPADHPDKAKEIGSESTPGEFIDTLLDVVEECRRVLAPHGSLVFELGDTYSGSSGAGGDYTPTDPTNGTWAMRAGQPKFEGSAAKSRRTRTIRPNQSERLNDDGSTNRMRSHVTGRRSLPGLCQALQWGNAGRKVSAKCSNES